MGIRESLERQQQEQGAGNLKDYAMPEDKMEQELDFDVEKEITPELWKKMLVELEKYRQKKQWLSFAELASAMKKLKPEEESNLKVEDSWPEIFLLLKFLDKRTAAIDYTKLAMFMSLLCPEKRQEIYIAEKWESRYNFVEANEPGDWDWNHYLANAMALLLIQPQKRVEIRNWVEKKFDFLLSDLKIFATHNDWLSYAIATSCISIIMPERKQEIIIKPEYWKGMKKKLDEMRHKSLLSFASLAFKMKILAAKEIRITDQDLELFMPEKKFRPEKHQRPERRNI